MDDITQGVLELARCHREWDHGRVLDGPEVELRDAGFGSLELVRLMLAVEARFEVVFPAEMVDVATFRTPRTLGDAVRSLREAGIARA
jgi:acyl carrier protein